MTTIHSNKKQKIIVASRYQLKKVEFVMRTSPTGDPHKYEQQKTLLGLDQLDKLIQALQDARANLHAARRPPGDLDVS